MRTYLKSADGMYLMLDPTCGWMNTSHIEDATSFLSRDSALFFRDRIVRLFSNAEVVQQPADEPNKTDTATYKYAIRDNALNGYLYLTTDGSFVPKEDRELFDTKEEAKIIYDKWYCSSSKIVRVKITSELPRPKGRGF